MLVIAETGNDMYMRMVDDLPGIFSVVHHEVNAFCFQCFFDYPRDHSGGFCHIRPVFGRNLKDIARVILMDDERMTRIYRMNIEKRDGLFILVDLERWQFTSHYFTEYAVVHTPEYKVQSFEWK